MTMTRKSGQLWSALLVNRATADRWR